MENLRNILGLTDDDMEKLKQSVPTPTPIGPEEDNRPEEIPESDDTMLASRSPASNEPKKFKVSDFLKTISGVESNFGKNTNHPVMKTGMHKGQSAIGKYALMPNTVDDIVKNIPAQQSEQYKQLLSMSPLAKKQYLEQNEPVQDELAKQLANRLVTRFKNPTKAAYAWNQGQYLDPNTITPERLANADYVRKFNNIRKKLGY